MVAKHAPGTFCDAGTDLRQLTTVCNDELVKDTFLLLGMLRLSADTDETDQLFEYCFKGTEDQAKTAINTLHSRAENSQKVELFRKLVSKLAKPRIMSRSNSNFDTVLTVMSFINAAISNTICSVVSGKPRQVSARCF